MPYPQGIFRQQGEPRLDPNPVYFVTDVETDGPDPGRHSMLSFASVACDARGMRLGHLALNLEPLDGHAADAGTMGWWATEPAAWAAVVHDRQPAATAIESFVQWVRGFGGAPVFVGYPLIFDGAWIDWYLRRFAGIRMLQAPRSEDLLFAGGGLDLGSFVMGRAGLSYVECAAKRFPRAWLGGHPHTHIALDDAEGYAHLLRHVLNMPPP
ncbi:MAG: polymerase subunit epsilon [Rubritepida sp.]|nr:polymerase subunit epsilon [Rubritepida sp.]